MTSEVLPRSHVRRWWILAVLAVAQLMVALDATVINIALPEAQNDLKFSAADRQWVITAYALAFGSLLLLGGRLSDLWGRRNSMVIGLFGFAVASAVGGASTSFTMLITARATQGAFAALLAPSTLAILTTTFRDQHERAKAFAIIGAIGGSGAAIGLLLGGFLTEYFSWRWCLYINLVFAAVALLGTIAYIDEARAEHRPRIDWLGTLLACAGFFLIVFGLGNAITNLPDGNERTNWAAIGTWGSIALGVVLIIAFVAWQHRSDHPLLPPRILDNRTRAGSLVALFVTSFGIFGVSLFLSYYLLGTLHYSAMMTGAAFLPLVVALAASAGLASARLLPVTGPRPLVPSGMLLGALGMILFTRLPVTDQYWAHVFPGLVILGLGLGLVYAPATSTATGGVHAEDAGATSALVNVTQQIGGSIGVALLNSIAIAYATAYIAAQFNQNGLPAPGSSLAGIVTAGTLHGTSIAYWIAAAFFVCGAVVTLVLLPNGVVRVAAPDEPEEEPTGTLNA